MPIEYHIPVPIDEKPLSKVPYSVPYSLNYQSTIFTQFSTIYQYLLTKNHSVKSKKCTRNDHRLKSKLYIPHRTKKKKKCKTAYNRLTLHPDLLPHQALQLHKAYIRTKLEYGCIIWGHTIYQKNMKQPEDAQVGALSLILRTMNPHS